jgi:hypothetical protein
MVLPFFPAMLILRMAGSRKERRTSRGKCPPPDSDPFNGVKSGKNCASLSSAKPATPNRRFKLRKRRQIFIRPHNETLPVVAMRVSISETVARASSKSNSIVTFEWLLRTKVS